MSLSLSNILQLLLESASENISSLYDYLECRKDDELLKTEIIDMIISKPMPKERFLCICIAKSLSLDLSEYIDLLFGMLEGNDESFLWTLAEYLSTLIKTTDQVMILMNLPINCTIGVVLTIQNLISKEIIIEDMVNYICSLVKSVNNDRYKEYAIMAFEKLCHRIGKDNQTIQETLFMYFDGYCDLELPNGHDSLLTHLSNMFSPDDVLGLLISIHNKLGQKSPIPKYSNNLINPLYNFALHVSQIIHDILYEYPEIEYDKKQLVSDCVLLTLISDSDYCVFENHLPEFIDNWIGEDAFETLRYQNSRILNNGNHVDIAIEICTEMFHYSPNHMEAAYYILSNILPKNTIYEIDLPSPDDDSNPFVIGSYVACATEMNYSIDESIFIENINSDGFVLPLLIIDVIITDDCYDEYIQESLNKVLSLFPLFETEVHNDLVQVVYLLIRKNADIQHYEMEQIIEYLFYYYKNVLLNSSSSFEFLHIFAALNENEYYRSCIHELLLPVAQETLQNPDMYEIGIDIISSILTPLKEPLYEYETFVIEQEFINVLKICVIHPYEISPILSSISFFVRIGHLDFFPNFIISLIQDDSLSDSLSSCCSYLLPIISKVHFDDQVVLFKQFVNLVISKNKISLYQHACCLISALSIDNYNNVESLLSSASIDFSSLIELFIDNFHDFKGLFDIKIILFGLYQHKHKSITYDDDPMLMLDVFYFLFIKSFVASSEIGDLDVLSFFPNDPFYLEHPFMKMNTGEYIEFLLSQDNEIPSRFRDQIIDIKKLY